MRRPWILAAFGAVVVIGGCVVVTGSTDSAYTQASSSTCTSSGDCGDAGAICCLGFSGAAAAGTSSLTTQCQMGPCQLIQLCAENNECGTADGGFGSCVPQACKVPGASTSVPFLACGLVKCPF